MVVHCWFCGKRTTHNTADPIFAGRKGEQPRLVGYRCSACRRKGLQPDLSELQSLETLRGWPPSEWVRVEERKPRR